jgi:hypothetical protein
VAKIGTHFVAHPQDTHDLATHKRARKDSGRVGNNDITRIAVSGQGARGRIEKTVDNEDASVFIKFIFDWLAA